MPTLPVSYNLLVVSLYSIESFSDRQWAGHCFYLCCLPGAHGGHGEGPPPRGERLTWVLETGKAVAQALAAFPAGLQRTGQT